MNQVIQIQNERKMSTYAKAQVIAVSRRIHKSSRSNIWMIESETVKGKFYSVQYVDVEGLGKEKELICDCPAYTYEMTNPCKHILSLAIKETM